MFVKGRGKWLGKQMPSLLEQMFSQLFGERSDLGKPKVFRGSARNMGQLRKTFGFPRLCLYDVCNNIVKKGNLKKFPFLK